MDVEEFLSTPSARRATVTGTAEKPAPYISIHALREEGDRTGLWLSGSLGNFYPRPPRGGRPHDVSFIGQRDFISIHALREEGDPFNGSMFTKSFISIHALREEGDKFDEKTGLFENEFLSTPSARRAT